MADQAPPPPRTWLRDLLGRADARPRVGRAVASLLGVAIVSIGAMSALLIWHLVRRGRLIREQLPPPRDVRLPDPAEFRAEPDPEPDREPSP